MPRLTVAEIVDDVVGEGVDVVPGRRAAGDLRPPTPRSRDAGRALARRAGTGRRSGRRALRRPRPTDATTRRVSDGRSVWIEPTAPGLTTEASWPRKRRSSPGRSKPSSPTPPRRPRWTPRAWTCCRPRRPPRSPAGTTPGVGGRAGRSGQDQHARRRPRGPAPSRPPRCSGWPPPPKRPGAGTRHRDARRHRRQAAPRMVPTRPRTGPGWRLGGDDGGVDEAG